MSLSTLDLDFIAMAAMISAKAEPESECMAMGEEAEEAEEELEEADEAIQNNDSREEHPNHHNAINHLLFPEKCQQDQQAKSLAEVTLAAAGAPQLLEQNSSPEQGFVVTRQQGVGTQSHMWLPVLSPSLSGPDSSRRGLCLEKWFSRADGPLEATGLE
eukprot:CAMPEP_0115139736 /NCGR_PEP_ID=MMETSP0227-20121206/58468_1 /TAXON_ID=89957 /ORGANISM="Polarella glacialis, Strain CCMP 1383" /LENGTH=158 /DNA_ID=CAMNT_0002547661 /DNA_START=66 /DNA_END=541 /DNA_ORIENTATION=+